MNVFHDIIELETLGGKATFFDITEDVKAFVKRNKVTDGIVVAQTPHTTCSVFFEEMVHDYDLLNNEYLQTDLNNGLSKVFPKQVDDQYYKHPGPLHVEFGRSMGAPQYEENPGRYLLNAHAHLKGTLIGPSLTIIVKDGQVMTGGLGHIYYVDWDDNLGRKRKCLLCAMGKTEE